MGSNKHHELAKVVMEQVSDLLVGYSVRQTNSFVNSSGTFPKLIKFDYLGKYSLKGTTHLLVEAGLEIAADYTYFNTDYTWKNTKWKYYISNFGCYRTTLVPYTNDDFFSKTYKLPLPENGLINVDLIRHELIHYFLPYLEQLNNVNDLIAFMHGHKPTGEEMTYAYRHHSFIYNWLTIIYLLLTEGRNQEAEVCLEKVIYIVTQPDPGWQVSEAAFLLIDKLQKDFSLSYTYTYDARLRQIVVH